MLTDILCSTRFTLLLLVRSCMFEVEYFLMAYSQHVTLSAITQYTTCKGFLIVVHMLMLFLFDPVLFKR